jgi:flagellar biosynthetic protein FlhB
MSDTYSGEARTERATPRRLQKAREEGSVVRAHAIAGVAVLLVGAGALFLWGGKLIDLLETSLQSGLSLAPEDAVEPARVLIVASSIMRPAAMILMPFLLLLAAVGFAADLLVGGWVFSAHPLTPDFQRVNPIKGFGRLFSHAALAEIIKALAKFAVITAVSAWLLHERLASFLRVASERWPYAPNHVAQMATEIFLILAAALAAVTLLEVPYQVWQHRDQLKMTRQDLREELRELEGSPQTRRRIRALRARFARARMMTEVPRADVVIVNPEHYAAALSYQEGRTRAPRLVAKGSGLIALRIRTIAVEHDVPVVEAPPLARAMNQFVGLGEEIPVGLYRAVAEVLAYVYRLKAARETGEATPAMPQDGRFDPPREFDA